MKERYFIVGLRPVIAQESKASSIVLSFDWITGTFTNDNSYHPKIYYGPKTDETEEVTKEEFDVYVTKLKKEKGLSS